MLHELRKRVKKDACRAAEFYKLAALKRHRSRRTIAVNQSKTIFNDTISSICSSIVSRFSKLSTNKIGGYESMKLSMFLDLFPKDIYYFVDCVIEDDLLLIKIFQRCQKVLYSFQQLILAFLSSAAKRRKIYDSY